MATHSIIGRQTLWRVCQLVEIPENFRSKHPNTPKRQKKKTRPFINFPHPLVMFDSLSSQSQMANVVNGTQVVNDTNDANDANDTNDQKENDDHADESDDDEEDEEQLRQEEQKIREKMAAITRDIQQMQTQTILLTYDAAMVDPTLWVVVDPTLCIFVVDHRQANAEALLLLKHYMEAYPPPPTLLQTARG